MSQITASAGLRKGEPYNSDDVAPEVGTSVIWHQERKWGGKQNVAAVSLGARGAKSVRIAIGNEERTVRLSSLTWSKT